MLDMHCSSIIIDIMLLVYLLTLSLLTSCSCVLSVEAVVLANPSTAIAGSEIALCPTAVNIIE